MSANESPNSALKKRLFGNSSQSSAKQICTVKSRNHKRSSSAISFHTKHSRWTRGPQTNRPDPGPGLLPRALPTSRPSSLYEACKLESAVGTGKSLCLPLLLSTLNTHLLSKQRYSKRLWWNFHAMEKLCNLLVMNMIQLSVKPLTKCNTKKSFCGGKKTINCVVFQYGPYYSRPRLCNKYRMPLTH